MALGLKNRGEWGKLSHPPQLNPKSRRRKKSKDLHLAALKIHLVVGKF